MFKTTRWVIDRFAERLIPLVGGMLATRVETAYALQQAEEQNLLEEEARRYEAEGKNEIAAGLRRRAERLSSEDAAAALPAPSELRLEGPATDAAPAPGRSRRRRESPPAVDAVEAFAALEPAAARPE